MKTIFNKIWMLVLLVGAFTACEETSTFNQGNGKPAEVTYVRMCDPALSDSLLSGAYLGTRIAIIGENLAGVQEIWFNDIAAKLNPMYITQNAIIVDVPSVIPEAVTNTIRLITADNFETVYPFKTIVPSPILNKMKCEFVNDGDTAIIYGNYFLGDETTPLTVSFFGNLAAEVVSYDLTSVSFKVPEGAQAGEISVTSMYGTTRSSFKFRDKTGLITDFHSASWGNPWGKGVRAEEDPCDGMYALFYSAEHSGWNWNEALMNVYWAPSANGNVPVAEGDYTTMALRFEINCITWTDVPLVIWFDTYGDNINIDDASKAQCHWKPWLKDGSVSEYKTDGWETITIPLTEFKYNKDESLTDKSIGNIENYTNINLFMFGAQTDPANKYPVNFKIDNVRIVPIN